MRTSLKILCFAAALVAIKADGMFRGTARELRACTTENPCNPRGRCTSDDQCRSDLICLNNGRCGWRKSNWACTSANPCDGTDNRKCNDDSECVSGTKCKIGPKTFTTCVEDVSTDRIDEGNSDCPKGMVFGFIPGTVNHQVCNAPEGFIMIDNTCGCKYPEFYDVETSSCVSMCEPEKTTCRGNLAKVDVMTCKQPNCGLGEVGIALANPGCGCEDPNMIIDIKEDGSLECVYRDDVWRR